ncbi:novel immune-type receptor 14b [Misgurnus anguillicaudatus]|uniref:novel immune-type receptor 14b n=1 Tax=Misgurnus anguillicaudatus TaxID=75329 RepID=UPI002434B4A1|nr:novel immune-type receptor 14b [Misgurnus anguillicaudatus]
MVSWVFITVLSIINFANSRKYQANEIKTVTLGDNVTLQCSEKGDTILWYKQIAGHRPQIISVFQTSGETTFYREFKNISRFQRNKYNLAILRIIQSDEAIYHCGSKAYYVTFGRGTHLVIKGQKESTASTISKSVYLNNSVECQQHSYENDTTQVKPDNHQDPVVFGLAVALGVCGVIIFILICLTFNRRMCPQCLRGSGQDSRVRWFSGAQETDDGILTYAALQFSQEKSKIWRK